MATSGYAYRFIERWYGGPVRIKASNPAASTGVTALVGNNPDRVSLIVTNLGVSTVYIAPDSAGIPSSTNGLVLSPQGGTMCSQVDTDGPLPSYGWNMIAASGAPMLQVLEAIGGP